MKLMMKLGKIICSKGFEKKIEDMRAAGYIVELNECSIRHSKQEEVTFK
jgi:hypothetical protein